MHVDGCSGSIERRVEVDDLISVLACGLVVFSPASLASRGVGSWFDVCSCGSWRHDAATSWLPPAAALSPTLIPDELVPCPLSPVCPCGRCLALPPPRVDGINWTPTPTAPPSTIHPPPSAFALTTFLAIFILQSSKDKLARSGPSDA